LAKTTRVASFLWLADVGDLAEHDDGVALHNGDTTETLA